MKSFLFGLNKWRKEDYIALAIICIVMLVVFIKLYFVIKECQATNWTANGCSGDF